MVIRTKLYHQILSDELGNKWQHDLIVGATAEVLHRPRLRIIGIRRFKNQPVTKGIRTPRDVGERFSM